MATLEVSRLGKRFGRVEALQGGNCSVEPGEVFGYPGPNGAGKATTLRIIRGLVRPGSGAVRLFGRPSTEASVRSSIGYLPGARFSPCGTSCTVMSPDLISLY